MVTPFGTEEKNKLATDSVWITALEITIPGEANPVRVCDNNEDIEWPTGSGNTFQAFPFEIDEIGDTSKGEIPRVDVRVGNVNRVMEQYVAAYDDYCKANGFEPVEVIIYVLNSNNLSSSDPEAQHIFELKQPKTDSKWATFTLGASNPFNRRFPQMRILKNHCRFHFNYPPGTDLRCGWSGSGYTTCGKTLSDCRDRSNSERFGGFPGVGYRGIRLA